MLDRFGLPPQVVDAIPARRLNGILQVDRLVEDIRSQQRGAGGG